MKPGRKLTVCGTVFGEDDMYCPKCGTTNPDHAKFCRACGTNMETVALALAGYLVTPGEAAKDKKARMQEQLLELRRQGIRQVSRAAFLLGVALLTLIISFVIAMAAREPAPLAIWVGLFGWMAIWGGISLAKGIPDMVEAKTIMRELGQISGERTTASSSPPLPNLNEFRMTAAPVAAPQSGSPPSVTEYTTELLREQTDPHVAIPEKNAQ
jgi:hypothetical protein